MADARDGEAIFYALRSGYPWRLLPDSFPQPTTVYRWFSFLRDRGIWQAIKHRLVMLERGHFIWPQAQDGTVSLTPAMLSMLLEGIVWRHLQRTWRPEAAG